MLCIRPYLPLTLIPGILCYHLILLYFIPLHSAQTDGLRPNAHVTPFTGLSPATLSFFKVHNLVLTSGTLLGFSPYCSSAWSAQTPYFCVFRSTYKLPMDSLVPRRIGYSLAILAALGMIWRLCSDPQRPLTLDIEATALPQPRFHLRITLGPAVSIGQHPTH